MRKMSFGIADHTTAAAWVQYLWEPYALHGTNFANGEVLRDPPPPTGETALGRMSVLGGWAEQMVDGNATNGGDMAIICVDTVWDSWDGGSSGCSGVLEG